MEYRYLRMLRPYDRIRKTAMLCKDHDLENDSQNNLTYYSDKSIQWVLLFCYKRSDRYLKDFVSFRFGSNA